MDKRVPEVRFKGFTDDWEQRKLGDIVKIIMGQSPSSSNYTRNPNDFILVQGNADIKNNKVNPRVWTKQVTKLVPRGTIILSVRASVGDVATTDYEVVIGRGVAGINGNYYIYQMLVKMKLFNYWKKISTGSTFESISSNDIKHAEILIPKLSEQTKIGTILKLINHLLDLQQDQLRLYVKLRKGLLQKLLPSDDSNFPKIRYLEFNNEWEKIQLGKVADIVGGGTPSTSNAEYWNGDINWYTPAEVGEKIYVNDSMKKITDLGLRKSSAHLLPIGTLLFTSRAGIGSTAILGKVGTTNQGFQSIVPHKNELDSYFIYAHSSKLKKYGEIHGAGSTFIEVSGKQMTKMMIKIPSMKEQKNIGKLINSTDNVIKLMKIQSETFNLIKKYLFQKLFI
ncbi:restriction endonuclease subunit S [Companilactobacillus sp. HBUAS59699]|uniref:restriction endonuclease subunit S n=1 Tax=Companilactobacillus sp. HBUAS59699 TaxID=3109358 RepID=UPI002FF1F1A0